MNHNKEVFPSMRLLGMLFLLLAIGAHEALAGKVPFTFENAEIEVVIKKASELTGLAFLYDPEQIKGRITLYLPDKGMCCKSYW